MMEEQPREMEGCKLEIRYWRYERAYINVSDLLGGSSDAFKCKHVALHFVLKVLNKVNLFLHVCA